MIVWLASYPRSGNTFLRIVLHRLYGVPTYVVYDQDGVAQRIGGDAMGFQERPADLATMAAADEVYFVKTHRQRGDEQTAICLVRDGRDALVSWARLRSELEYEQALREQILRPDLVGTGAWGRNVLSWLRPPDPRRIVLRYDDLVADPTGAVHRLVDRLAPGLRPLPDATLPTFADLHREDAGFFRRGRTGSWREELPADLHDLFWAQPHTAEAMNLLGYQR